MKITKQALGAAKKLKVNLDKIELITLKKAINVELEHGKHSKTNITNDSINFRSKKPTNN
jgi:hypothetical protein